MASTTPQMSEKERAASNIFARLAGEADRFEGYAHPHAARVGAIAEALALSFGLGREDVWNLRVAALAHDLGEMAMRRDYIKREGPLSDEERLDLARHPVIGEQEAARAGADRGAQLLVRWHHEWWNGAGYPDALRREQIPLPARILRAADSYAALTDDRPYRRVLAEAAARRHMTEWAAIEFDPRVVRALLSLTDVPELRSYARRDEGAREGHDRAGESSEVDRAEVDRVAVDHAKADRVEADRVEEVDRDQAERSGVESARAVGGEVSRPEVSGPAGSGADEWGVPRR